MFDYAVWEMEKGSKPNLNTSQAVSLYIHMCVCAFSCGGRVPSLVAGVSCLQASKVHVEHYIIAMTKAAA